MHVCCTLERQIAILARTRCPFSDRLLFWSPSSIPTHHRLSSSYTTLLFPIASAALHKSVFLVTPAPRFVSASAFVCACVCVSASVLLRDYAGSKNLVFCLPFFCAMMGCCSRCFSSFSFACVSMSWRAQVVVGSSFHCPPFALRERVPLAALGKGVVVLSAAHMKRGGLLFASRGVPIHCSYVSPPFLPLSLALPTSSLFLFLLLLLLLSHARRLWSDSCPLHQMS